MKIQRGWHEGGKSKVYREGEQRSFVRAYVELMSQYNAPGATYLGATNMKCSPRSAEHYKTCGHGFRYEIRFVKFMPAGKTCAVYC
jgi:hypothetical protein